MIKNIEDLKKYQIICIERKDVKHCSKMLKKLGFEVRDNDSEYKVIQYREYNLFETAMHLKVFLKNCFFDEKLIKTLQKLIREKEKTKDIEIGEDGRIIKINNKGSEKEIFVVYDEAYNYDYEYYKENAMKIVDMAQNYLDFCLKYGLAYATPEARDRAMFKLEIETKLENIAERLNNVRKINWEDENQAKFRIYYDYNDKKLDFCDRYWRKDQGIIYCLDEDFLEVAKKEIGELNLIKYFEE